MELLYLWIDEYFTLRDCSLNFSNQFFFDIKFLDADRLCQLHVQHNNKYVPNFFPANILGVTAIVGVNGVGKSTLLDFILRCIHNEETTGTSWVAVFNKNSKFVVYSHLIKYKGIKNWETVIIS